MKQTNNAIKFLLSQYRAIFKHAYVKGLVSAVALTAGLASGAANADTTTALENATEWNEALQSGNGTITIGTNGASGSSGNYQNLEVVANTTTPIDLSLSKNQTLVIDAQGNTIYTANKLQASGAGLNLVGSGTLSVKGNGNSEFNGEGIQLIASNSGNLTVNLGKIETDGMIYISASGAESVANISAKEIIIGNNEYDASKKGKNDGRANIYLGDSDTTNTDNKGQITFGATDTTLTIYKDGKLRAAGNSGGTIIAAGTINVEGGILSFVNANSTPYNTKITSHDVNVNSGWFDLKSGSKVTLELDSGSDTSAGTMNFSGTADNKSYLVVGDALILTQGQVTLDDNTILAGRNGVSGTNAFIQIGNASSPDSDKAVLNVSTQTLKSYLTAKTADNKTLTYIDENAQFKSEPSSKNATNGSILNATSGSILLKSDGTLNLTTTADLATDFYFSGGAQTLEGGITVSGTGLITGNNLTVSKQLTESGSKAVTLSGSDNLYIKADTLTLGSSICNSTTTLGFASATARNVNFKAKEGATFTLVDELTLSAIDEITNPFDSSEKIQYAGTGNINDSLIVSGSKPLTVAAGNYTNDNDLTLASGELVIGSGSTAVDAQLIQKGDFTLDNTSGENTITIAGNTDSIQFVTNTTYRDPYAVLDISDSTLEITSGSQHLSTIKVEDNGAFIVNEDQFKDIVNEAGKRTGNSGAEIILGSGALVQVNGDIENKNGTAGLSVNKFTSGAGDTTDKVSFSGAGSLKANSIWLFAAKGETLNIGSGTLQADTIKLDQAGKTGEVFDNFVITSGNLVVGSRLDSSNSNTLQIGNGTNDATVQLGYINKDTDKWGIEKGTFTTSSDTGSISQNLKLNGNTSTALNVEYGTWSAQNIDITNGTLNVGSTDSYADANGNDVLFNAALNAKALTLNAGSSVNVSDTGSASFTSLKMADGAVRVNGQLTISGTEYNASGNNAYEKYGVSITGGTIDVDGRNALLTFGNNAVKSITVSGDSVTFASGTFDNNITLDHFATLKLDFGDIAFSEKALQELRKGLFSNATTGAALDAGYIDLGSASIKGVTVTNGTVDWKQLSQFKDITDIKIDELSSATLINVDGTTPVNANVGNIQATGSVSTILLGDTVLSKANKDGNFIFNTANSGEAIGASIASSAHVTLENGGNVGAVSLTSGTLTDQTILNVVSSGDAVTNIKSISADTDTLVNISGTTKVEKNVDAHNLQVDQALTVAGNVDLEGDLTSGYMVTTGSISAKKLNVECDTEYSGNLNISGTSTFKGEAYLGGYNNTFGDTVVFEKGLELDRGTTTADTIRFKSNTQGNVLDIVGYANLTANVIESADNKAINITVGEEAGSGDSIHGPESWESAPGFLTVGRLDLNGGELRTDPEYGKSATIVAVKSFGDTSINPSEDGNDAGTLNGDIYALRNSIVGIGVGNTADATAIDQLKATFSKYIGANGSLDDKNVGAIVYVAEALNLNNDSQIIVDSSKSFSSFENTYAADTSYKQAIDDNDIYLGSNSVLAISDKASIETTKGSTTKVQRAAIEFATTDASLFAEKNAKVVLVGDGFSTRSDIMLFSDADTEDGKQGIEIKGNDLTVETINGLLSFTLKADGTQYTGDYLELNREAIGSSFSMASAPVKNSLIAYAANDNDWQDTATDHEADVLHGDVATGIYHKDGKFYTDKECTDEASGDYVLISSTVEGQTVNTIYHDAYNAFIDDVVRNSTTGLAAEQAARLSVYGGTAQAALTAGATTYEAISGRMGVGAQTGSITLANNGQGAGLWVTPVYKNQESDGFGAQGLSYGADLDMYGLALGGDFTMANGLRVGAAFNLGSGDADGNGAASGVSNDFDYYGFAVYGGYSMDKFSVVADASYTVVDNDVDANTDTDKLSASMDSSNLSVGVTGQYTFNYNGLNVVPHAGLRYTYIDMDDYSVKGAKYGDVADFAADSFSVFSIPVGVTFSKEFTTGTWTIQPAFDLTLTANMGDDSVEGTVNWAGATNLQTKVESEVVDSFTYGATLGVSAKSGNMSFGFGVNYTGASNADEYGVSANARFVF